MEFKVSAQHIRMSPRKVRAVIDVVRGMDVEEALTQLNFMSKRATRVVTKLVNSAIANAEHNHEAKRDNLYIKTITVDDGPTLGRWMPRAFGRATRIRKRTCRIAMILGEKVASTPKKKVAKADKKDDLVKVSDYKSVPKGAVPEMAGEDVDEGEKKAVETDEKKDEPVDKTRQGKHRHPEAQERAGKGGKGFIKKMFKRKSV